MIRIKDRIFAFKKRLFSTGEGVPLSILSLVVIFALDILVLTTIYSGLSDHTRQIVSPQQYVYGECRDVYLNHDWTKDNRMSKLQSVVLIDYRRPYFDSYYGGYLQSNPANAHKICQELFAQLKQISGDKVLKEDFLRRDDLIKLKNKLNLDFQQTKKVYDTTLLEKIADKKAGDNAEIQASTVAQKHVDRIQKINREIDAVEQNINSNGLVATLWQTIDNNAAKTKQVVRDYKRFQFWYPVKRLLWKLLFLLPIFLLFYFWFARSVKKESKMQTLLASHLVVVAAIPLVIEVADTVLDLIPKHLLVKLFQLLESLHLVAIWYYLVIFVAIGAAFAAIAIIQKTLFNKERLYQKRLMKGACYSCAKKLPEGAAKICPFCGANQLKSCGGCGKETFINAAYCIHCGDKTLTSEASKESL